MREGEVTEVAVPLPNVEVTELAEGQYWQDVLMSQHGSFGVASGAWGVRECVDRLAAHLGQGQGNGVLNEGFIFQKHNPDGLQLLHLLRRHGVKADHGRDRFVGRRLQKLFKDFSRHEQRGYLRLC